jgi:hypothetical protein
MSLGDQFNLDDNNGTVRIAGTLNDPGATTGDVLTVQSDGSIAAEPGGGSGSALQSVTVTLAAAAIATLFSDPPLIIAAPGAGKALCPLYAVSQTDGGTTPWTFTGDSPYLSVSSDQSGFGFTALAILNMLSNTAAAFGSDPAPDDSPAGQPNAVADNENRGVYLSVDDGDPTGGGDLGLRVTVFYVLLDV